MASEKCPNCGGKNVRCSSYFWRNLFRKAGRSDRRYCMSCGDKWRVGGYLELAEEDFVINPYHLVLVILLLVVLLAFLWIRGASL